MDDGATFVCKSMYCIVAYTSDCVPGLSTGLAKEPLPVRETALHKTCVCHSGACFRTPTAECLDRQSHGTPTQRRRDSLSGTGRSISAARPTSEAAAIGERREQRGPRMTGPENNIASRNKGPLSPAPTGQVKEGGRWGSVLMNHQIRGARHVSHESAGTSDPPRGT